MDRPTFFHGGDPIRAGGILVYVRTEQGVKVHAVRGPRDWRQSGPERGWIVTIVYHCLSSNQVGCCKSQSKQQPGLLLWGRS